MTGELVLRGLWRPALSERPPRRRAARHGAGPGPAGPGEALSRHRVEYVAWFVGVGGSSSTEITLKCTKNLVTYSVMLRQIVEALRRDRKAVHG